MRNAHCKTWSMAKELKKIKNEKNTLQEVKYREKHQRGEKREMLIVGPVIWCEN